MLSNNEFMKSLIGQGKLKKLFNRLIAEEKLPHAMLFYGPDGTGKEAAAMELGKLLLCQDENRPCGNCRSCRQFSHFEHPDFFFLFPIAKPKKEYKGGEWESALSEKELELYRNEVDKKAVDYYYKMNYSGAQSILIGQVRNLIQKSTLTAHSGDNRFAIISPAHLMNREAQNSLLKLLEEPPGGFYLCLCTSRPEALLPTTVSRCQPFYFPPLKRDEVAAGLKSAYGVDAEKAESVADRSDGDMVRAIELVKSEDTLRTVAVDGVLMQILTKKYGEFFKILREFQMYGEYGDKSIAKEILLNIDHWLRDIDLMDHGLEPVYNRDLMDRLEKFRASIAYENIPEMRELLLKSVDLIDKNVYIDTIYLNIANCFSKNMIWKR